QTVFYEVTDALVRLWAPILSFTAEEIYSMFKPEVESVFLTQFPEVVKHENADELKSRWGSYMKVRDDILKALEEARNSGLIGKALEAKIYLKLKDEYRSAVEGLSDHDLAQLVIVSQFELTEEENTEYDTGWIKVEKFDGCTCPRCWNVVSHVDEDGLCDRCHYIVK
ncbi:MAG: class I tRNA ligase family protein, partial [Erysipelotrichaceae bacterium]|nr:class I tRNA ligase family protein [Erysipelotrichaceae bacterium]